ncbi:Fido domain-containing protein [Armadillidium vulgare]|nr:Fido domain-containing protein [Armadillidium vulgare]
MRLKEYKRCLPKQESVSFNENEMLLYLNFFNGDFDIFRSSLKLLMKLRHFHLGEHFI